jgi:CBS domain containing-hemolysin-like protein
MTIIVPILIIVLLLLLNALFVAAEFALIGVPRVTVERRAAAGHRTARRLARILSTPRLQDQYIATAQLGITVASLGLGMYGENVVAGWIAGWLQTFGPAGTIAEHTIASVIAIVLLTYFHIVIGEMVPKTLALQYSGPTSLWITPLMAWIRIGLYPLVFGLNGMGNMLLRMIGIRRTATHQVHSPEELELIIEESERGGTLDESSAELMTEVLALRQTTAGELMVPRVRVTGLPVDASIEELREVLVRTRHTRYPVYEQSIDSIVGVVHAKDLLPSLLGDLPLTREHVRTLPFVPETMAIDDVVNAMRSAEVQMAVVMDEHGGTAGILTEKDLLDELVGEIHEDSERTQIWSDDSGRLHVAGTLLLTDLGEYFERDLEHEDVNTVSGLILALLERPPKPGDSVEYKALLFTVSGVVGHGVDVCAVETLQHEQKNDSETKPNN